MFYRDFVLGISAPGGLFLCKALPCDEWESDQPRRLLNRSISPTYAISHGIGWPELASERQDVTP